MRSQPSAVPPAFWRGALPRMARQGLLPAVIFRLIFMALYSALLSPLAIWMVDRALTLSGRAVVANFGIVGIVRSPVGIVMIVVLLIGIIAVGLAQQAGLTLIGVRALVQQPTSLFGTFRVLGGRARPLFGAALAMAALALIVVLPLAAIAGLTYWLLLTGADINYFLSTRPPQFQIAVGIGGFLAALGLVAWVFAQVRLIFVAPIVMFEGKQGIHALRTSNAMVHEHSWRVLRALLAWLAVAFVLVVSISLLTSAIAATITPPPGASPSAIATSVGVLLIITSILFGVQSLIGELLYAALVSYLYADLRSRYGLATMAELPKRLDANARRVGSWKVRLGIAGAGVLFLLAAAALVGLGAQALAVRPHITIIAHRAGAAGAPENSLTALRRTIDQKIATYAEIDVQETADGGGVVVHDSDLRRLANVNARVWDLSLTQVEQADIGSKVGPQFTGERIPTFDEFLDASKGKMKLNIELKYDRAAPLLAGKVVDLIRAKGMQNEVVISSLNAEGLAQVRKLAPELKIGLIYEIEIGSVNRLDVDFLEPSSDQVTSDLMATAEAR